MGAAEHACMRLSDHALDIRLERLQVPLRGTQPRRAPCGRVGASRRIVVIASRTAARVTPINRR
jgi:hypothetical protein